ncbi:hypothetical protein [Mesorhizobium sp. 1M-11]|uniref:hypothetical protein n=1 Tax=Mesorhizobium sp. 1M-11 TaxID=1529006 RepID=UPI0006C74BD2|nr:hypothetical protein [Mesorhizobium sp. 1M-11]
MLRHALHGADFLSRKQQNGAPGRARRFVMNPLMIFYRVAAAGKGQARRPIGAKSRRLEGAAASEKEVMNMVIEID